MRFLLERSAVVNEYAIDVFTGLPVDVIPGRMPECLGNLLWRVWWHVALFYQRPIARKKEAKIDKDCDFSHFRSLKEKTPGIGASALYMEGVLPGAL
jgi:hypothetical protein